MLAIDADCQNSGNYVFDTAKANKSHEKNYEIPKRKETSKLKSRSGKVVQQVRQSCSAEQVGALDLTQMKGASSWLSPFPLG